MSGKQEVRGDREHAHARATQDEARQQLAGHDGVAVDWRDEHSGQRAVPPLGEDARDPELNGEEEKEDRHAGGVERSCVKLTALGRDVCD